MFSISPPDAVDKFTTAIEAELHSEFQVPTVDEYIASIESEFIGHLTFDFPIDGYEVAANVQEGILRRERKVRAPNAFPYYFGDVWKANWYVLFLKDCARERTYFLSSRDRFGEFRCLFRMPLHKIDDLVTRFVENGWVRLTKHCRDEEEMTVRLELRILGVLKVLGHHCPFRTLKSDTNISTYEHRAFFHYFIDRMYGIRHEFIDYPSSEEDLGEIVQRYEANYLPGCGGSVDVVHIKWSKCPAGDVNRAKGKERRPPVPITAQSPGRVASMKNLTAMNFIV